MAAVKNKSGVLNIDFQGNHDALHHFWVWLCESGEQQYWEWMRYREEEDEGDITVLDFNYAKADGGMIKTKIGRFTGPAEDPPEE